MKIYFAGPDVFRPDVGHFFEDVRQRCAAAGIEHLIPVDGPQQLQPGPIFHSNVRLLRAADLVLANLNPFRGAEPDSGTVWEVAYAYAAGTPVIGYLSDGRSTVERMGGLVDIAVVIGDVNAAIDEVARLWCSSRTAPCI